MNAMKEDTGQRQRAMVKHFKTPKFVEMDTELLIRRSDELAAVKVMYEAEISRRAKQLLVKKEKSCCYILPECKVCYDEGMCVVDTVLPCGHMFCSRCSSKLVECPMCSTVVTCRSTFVFGIERCSAVLVQRFQSLLCCTVFCL